MGIKETMEFIEAFQGFVNAILKDSEDGKITILEILGDYPEVLAVINSGKDFKQIEEELKDLDQAEVIQLTENLIQIIFTILAVIKNLKK